MTAPDCGREEQTPTRLIARLEELRGVHSWEDLYQMCNDVLCHGEEGTARWWSSSEAATAAGIFRYLGRLIRPEETR